ncbi:Transcription termination factor like [Quillaja saponaria]|uniref:Transcription termination factor like n=1 Tax=Quillaja saponaria TaxID=32244 RepID=A0AAD7LVK0_QUISA|nr:Transcription termination factor like [Quillaja saponaria]
MTKEMGFIHMKSEFVLAIQVFAKLNKSRRWEYKLQVYEKWRWSKDVTLLAFKKHPICMLLSEDKITKSMNFLVNEMGWPSEAIARYPLILFFSLEKRIVPRCSVVQVLKLKGLIQTDVSLATLMTCKEEKFLKNVVANFPENAPLLLDVYKGQMGPLDVVAS